MNKELIEGLAREAGFYAEPNVEKFHTFARLIVKHCGYYADIFEALGCPDDMDKTDTKPSDYIKKQFGVE